MNEGDLMKAKIIVMLIILAFAFLILSGCDLLPPEVQLAVEITYFDFNPDFTVYIEYTMTNIGDVALSNCKVSFGIDETYFNPGPDQIYFDEVTYWDPLTGVDLSVGENYDGTVDSVGTYAGGFAYVGVYAVGFDNPPDDD
jgi:hypothetical protein